jgi:hypothetical protein
MISEVFPFMTLKLNAKILNYRAVKNAFPVCVAHVTTFLKHKARGGKGPIFLNSELIINMGSGLEKQIGNVYQQS